MPIALSEAGAAAWLTSETLASAAALDILIAYEAPPAFEIYAASTGVDVRKDDAALVQRATRTPALSLSQS